MNSLIKWFTTKPATKAAWAAVIVTLGVNSFLIWQNSQTLAVARTSLLLAIDPSIEVLFTSDSAYVTNTSPVPIVDLRIHPLAYRIRQEPFTILERNQPSDFYRIAEQLDSDHRVTIAMNHLIDDRAIKLSDDPNVIRVAVFTFRRQYDREKFTAIEIFAAVPIERRTVLFALFSGKNTAQGAEPYYFKRILDEIVSIERTYFKVSAFR